MKEGLRGAVEVICKTVSNNEGYATIRYSDAYHYYPPLECTDYFTKDFTGIFVKRHVDNRLEISPKV